MKLHVTNLKTIKISVLAILVSLASPVLAKLPFVPFPKEVNVSVVGEDIEVNGLPVMAYEFYSKRGTRAVAEFYKSEWSKKESKSDVDQPYLETQVPGWTILSRLESGHNITIQIGRETIAGVQVLVGVSPLPTLLKRGRKQVQKNRVPSLGRADIVSLVESNDGGKKSEVYWIDSKDSVDASFEVYKKYYQDKGYKVSGKRILDEMSKKVDSASLLVVSANERVRIDYVDVYRKTRIVAARELRD